MSGNKKLLEEANKNLLKTASELGFESEDGKKAYEMAMRGLELESAMDEKELKKKDSKMNVILRCIEIGGTIIIIPVIDYICKDKFARRICNFEKDYSFTTTPGRALGSLFRFKK